VKNESVSLLLAKDAPDNSGEPAAGRRSGEVRLIRLAPMTSATVILSTLFLAAASKYATCWSTVYGTATVPVFSTKFYVIPARIVFSICSRF